MKRHDDQRRAARTAGAWWLAASISATGLVPSCGGETSTESKADKDGAKGPSQAAAPAQAKAAEPEPVTEVAPGVQDDGEIVSAVTWFHGSLDDALTKAKAEGKLVFVDVGAYWCPPCHQLDEETFTQQAVGKYLSAGYVSVHLDAEKGEGPELAERYHVQAYPTMLVLEAGGLEKGRLVDFMPGAELIEALTRLSEGGDVLATLQAQVESKPEDLEARYRLAHAYVLAAKREEAERELEAVMVADPKNELGLAAKVAYDRALFLTYKLDGDPEKAIEDFRQLQKRYKGSKQAVRAYRHIGRLLNKLGKPDEAIASLDAMLKTDPDNTSLASSYGWFSFRQKCRPERGLEVVSAALEQDPKSADLHYLAAELSHQLGKHDAALESIIGAVKLEPESAFYRRMQTRFTALAEGA